ncbi:MAG TPA: NUDIX hydrolase [Thermoflexales bacterium]|nr:NUDIX hydrolase [Thermoflexales bacterium]HQW35074.1 NUDIX hydrolase [Thermoflexales bacterium]HQZ21624.1 NUDIX hydrolase [Thermoflexales bacterium]HQZ99883.1 NUDIX hydrolase [Thermoflexales bacterium]
MEQWKTRSRRTLYQHLPWITLEQREIELPNGKVIPDWTWVDTPDFINIAVITTEGKFALFRQNKYAVDGVSLAPVGGYLEPGEDPLDCAKRELREELGYEAATWLALGKYAVDGNRGCGNGHLFLATDARKTTERNADDLEEQEFVLLSREDVQTALLRGEFKVMPWAAVMALALMRV